MLSMTRVRILPYLLLLVLIATACKKDKLHFSNVEKIETGTTNRLNKIIFVDNNTGFIVGGSRFYEANILKTTDGGKSWIFTSFPEAGKGLYGINKAPNGTISSIGFDGKLMHTKDNGAAWNFTQLSLWMTYKDLVYKSDNSALVIGGNSFNSGFILKMDTNFNLTMIDSMAIELNDIKMLDDNTGYISGYGAVFKTIDGGKTWNFLDIKNDNFKSIALLNDHEMWVCGIAGSIYHSTNGGADWEKQRNGNNLTGANYALLDILFIDPQNGWAVGEKGLVIHSTDGGEKWSKYESFTESALRDITLLSDGNLLVCGDDGSLYKLYR